MMETTKVLLEKMMEFEGCRLKAYRDAAGVATIGYGHTKGVHMGDRITAWCAKEYLRQDIEEAEQQVLQLGVAKTVGQLEALTDFVFNLGIARLRLSTLLKKIRQRRPKREIRAEFMRWVYASGKRMPGLVKRRQWEANRYFENNHELREF